MHCILLAGGPAQDVPPLHEALERLAAHDPKKANLVEMRFFAGLILDRAADWLGISPRTADRAWRYARAWLYTAMAGPNSGEK
jgi:DNA-directed RNA polymerase specialized sigma24 family protein